jgi:hypothetical protein
MNQIITKCELENMTIAESQVLLECNGKSTTVNISVSPLLNDSNEPIGSVVAMEDLSNLDKLKSGCYIDAHCPRPYNNYKNEIDELIKIIKNEK